MLKTRTKAAISFIGVLSVAAGLSAGTLVARQAMAACPDGSTCAGNTTFQVNVVESLTVQVTTPETWASGGIDTFLRNAVGLSVTSNNSQGFTASMHSSAGTDLNNTSKSTLTLPTMASSETRSGFTANHWGYSLKAAPGTNSDPTYGETDAGNSDSYYYPMTASTTAPTTVLYSDTAASKDQTIYFGAKANASQASGTYAGTVVINVVTGDVDDTTNPVTPTNPATDNTGDAAAYNAGVGVGSTSASGTTTYTTTASGTTVDATGGSVAASSTTTQVSAGDVTSSYSSAQGVTTSSDGTTNGAVAAALATTAGVAAVSSMFFFILAKRRKDDDDEEEEQA